MIGEAKNARSQPIKTAQAGATSSAALRRSNLTAQCDRFQKRRGTVSEFASADQDCSVAIAIRAGYRQAFETTNEFVRTKF